MKRVHRLVSHSGTRLVLVGGILGLDADAKIVEDEFGRMRPASVLLGVPYEDLDAVRSTMGKQAETEFDVTDMDEAYLLRLGEYGLVKSPPPDLYRAYQLADDLHVPVEAIDLGDEEFTERFTKNVGMLEVLRSNRNHRRVAQRQFAASGPEDFALQWDEAMYPTKGLQRLQEEREEHMVAKLQTHARGAGPYLALLPLPRAIGVLDRLLELGWRKEA